MKAIVQDTYGEPDVLELRDIPPPHPAEDEVLVRVRAAGVDRGVWHLMAGLPYPVRLAFGLRAPRPPGLTFEEAAALPVSGATALQALRDHARVTAGNGCW